MPDMVSSENVKEFFNSNYKKIPFFVNYISTIFIKILDKIVNGFIITEKNGTITHKYYRYFISAILILILCLFYYLNEKQNIFDIKNTKYEIIITLALVGFSIYCFLFFVYRNNTPWDNKGSSSDNDNGSGTNYINQYKKRSLIKEAAKEATKDAAKDAAKDDSKSKSVIDKDVLKNTLTRPLFNIMKYIFYLLLLILIPIFVINYALYLHNNYESTFNVTKYIILILILLILLAILAFIFSIKTSSESKYCEIPTQIKNNTNELPGYMDLLKHYAKYFLCIFKNLIFFIPCLLVIITTDINNDIRLTPSPVYILFFILLILILLLFLLPIIYKYIRTINKSDVLQGAGPFYLNKERTLGKYQNLNTHLSKSATLPNIIEDEEEKPSDDRLDKIMTAFNIDKTKVLSTLGSDKQQMTSLYDTGNLLFNKGSESIKSNVNVTDDGSDTKAYTLSLFKDANSTYNIKSTFYNTVVSKERFPYNYTYSVTFYIYINPQPVNTSIAYTKDTVLFNYAYKPVIYYNGKSQKIIIKSRTISNRGDQLDTIYELENPKFQKWLFFVINYDNNIIDVFVDGKLVGSKDKVSPYFKGDNITIGENDGIHGSIKEIFYYNKITTPSTIELLYNLSKNTD